MTRVLHLITDLGFGGAQSALVRMLGARRHHAEVAWIKPVARPDHLRRLGEMDVPAHPLGASPAALLRLLRRRRPDVLQCWLFHADILGRVVGRLAGVPRVLGSRRNTSLGAPWRDVVNRLTAPLVDLTVAVSEEVARVERARGVPRVAVVPNGIDAAPFRDIPPPSGARLGFVGRLHRNKGLDVALRALPAASLLVVGDGPERPRLEAMAGPNVRFAGPREDLAAVLAEIDVLLLPSRCEGMSNVLLEAMAAGRPVVATRVGGTPEVVVDGETGLLVPPEDPAALAAAVRSLDGASIRRMGLAGRERVLREFTVETMARRMEALYESSR